MKNIIPQSRPGYRGLKKIPPHIRGCSSCGCSETRLELHTQGNYPASLHCLQCDRFWRRVGRLEFQDLKGCPKLKPETEFKPQQLTLDLFGGEL